MGNYLRNHEVRFEPIEQWPGVPTKGRKRSQFRASYGNTLTLLDRELEHLKAKNIVLQVCVDRNRIRLDGILRSDARPSSPGVILSFRCKHGELMYPCDTYDDWQDNLRAIAMALEALRAVDRYGVTSRAEQYRGWQQLPSPEGPVIKTRDQALQFLGKVLGCTLNELRGVETIDAFVRQAQFKTHPDHGGSPEDFKRVMECEKVLKFA